MFLDKKFLYRKKIFWWYRGLMPTSLQPFSISREPFSTSRGSLLKRTKKKVTIRIVLHFDKFIN